MIGQLKPRDADMGISEDGNMAATADLLEVAIPLQPRVAGPAPPGLASTGHGFVFRLLEREPSAGARLHAAGQSGRSRQPFTVSPLLDAPLGVPVRAVEPGRWYWLRLTFLTAELVELWRRLAPELPDELFLGPEGGARASWTFICGLGMPGVRERATTYGQLLQGELVPNWHLRFVTPTTFQLSIAPDDRGLVPALFQPFPVPELLLRNLARGWAGWAPPELAGWAAPEHLASLAKYIQIERSRLQVALSPGADQRRPAFTGEAVLAYRSVPRASAEDDRARLRLLRALLGLAGFSGVGVQTARGMGVLDAVPLQAIKATVPPRQSAASSSGRNTDE